MLTKKTFLLILFAALHLPMSCIVPNCGSDVSFGRVNTIESEFGLFNVDFRPYQGLLSQPWNEVGIRVYPDDIEFFSSIHFNFSLSNTAYACDPPPPEFAKITDISVIIEDDIRYRGNSYSRGDTINHLFMTANSEAVNIAAYIERQNQEPWLFGDFSTELILQLIEAPQDTVNSSVQINMLFEEGTTLSTSSRLLVH